jgi:hypothetical protein
MRPTGRVVEVARRWERSETTVDTVNGLEFRLLLLGSH